MPSLICDFSLSASDYPTYRNIMIPDFPLYKRQGFGKDLMHAYRPMTGRA